MPDIDLYSTHLDLLQNVFANIGKQKNVVEFGMGNFSTEFLLKNSDRLVSIEMQSEDWYNNMVNKFGNNKNWKHLKLIGPNQYTSCIFDNTDFAFVDGHGETRPECVNLMFSKKAPVIIAHDTEAGSYGWNRVQAPSEYFSFIFKKYENWSTVWTTNQSLYNHLKCLQ